MRTGPSSRHRLPGCWAVASPSLPVLKIAENGYNLGNILIQVRWTGAVVSRPIKAVQDESVPPPPVKHTTSLIKSSPCSAAVSRRFTASGRQDRRTVRGVGAAAGGGGRPPSRGGEARTGRCRGPRADSNSHPYRTGRHEGRWRSVTPRRGVFSHAPAHYPRGRVDRSPCGGRSAIRSDRLF